MSIRLSRLVTCLAAVTLLLATQAMPLGATSATANRSLKSSLEEATRTLARVDLQVAEVLARGENIRGPEAQESLAALRMQANAIVFRVTRELADDFPCRPTRLQPTADAPTLPEAHEFVAFDQAPRLVSMQAPRYPQSARQAGIEGTVHVRVLVDRAGRVVDCRILRSVAGLDEAALDSAWTAVFEPAVQNTESVAVWLTVPIEFRLQG